MSKTANARLITQIEAATERARIRHERKLEHQEKTKHHTPIHLRALLWLVSNGHDTAFKI
jgi:hypothetical protein